MYPTARFLLFEVSTIFVDMHWFLEKCGYVGRWPMIINDTMGLLAYLAIRLIMGTYFTALFVKDVWTLWHRIPHLLSFIGLFGNLTTHLLNFYWFYKLSRSLFRTVTKARSKTRKTA